jgi:GDP-L-fucose synthase
MKILLLGATGFLGQSVNRHLKQKKLDVVRSSLSLGTDLLDSNATQKLFDSVQPSHVINCAAYVGGIQFVSKYKADVFSNNLMMSLNILTACKNSSVKRLVNPISNCAYPKHLTLFQEKDFWNGSMHESVAAYGISKRALTIAADSYYKQYGLEVINIVLSNMYGPNDHFDEERSHALGALIKKMIEAKEKKDSHVDVWGTGSPVREWLHVDDASKALIKAINIDFYPNLINIGTGKGISIKNMSELLKDLTKFPGELRYLTDKPDGAAFKTVDGTLGHKLLNWTPSYNFEQGVRETIEWYTSSKNLRKSSTIK